MPYKDPEQQKKAQHQHYVDNRENYRESHRRSKLRKAKWLRDLKKDMKCIRCGFDNPAALQFHHPEKRNGVKTETISYLIRKYTKEKLLEEIKKCEILCANCHCIEHYSYLYE